MLEKFLDDIIKEKNYFKYFSVFDIKIDIYFCIVILFVLGNIFIDFFIIFVICC